MASCAALTLALQCLVYLTVPSIGAEDGLIHDGKEAAPAAPAAPYDCHSFSQASLAARQWCCTHKGIACTTQGPTEFNCTGDVETPFSEEKRLWCCSHEKVGCLNTSDLNSTTVREKMEVAENSSNTSVANETEAYDCTTGSNTSKAWSSAQMTWCCQHGACGNESTFNCSDASIEWSELKKSWCCQHFGLTCPDQKVAKSAVNTTGSDNQSLATNDSVGSAAAIAMLVDAMVAAENEANKTQGNSGSILSDHKDAYDCVTGASNWTLEWTNEQAIWCCKFRNVSCNAGHPVASQTFDCRGSTEDWPLSKQQWCCDTHQLGCTTPTTSATSATSATSTTTQAGAEVADRFDCDKEGYWSRSRQAWCCERKEIGCYSCTADAEEWSIPKKLWCCEHRPSRACEKSSNQFQCNLEDLETWSEQERAWCCKTKNQGCDPDCDLDSFPLWSRSQQIWCCQMKGLGCPAQQTSSALFDCFEDDTDSWSQMKSRWCCSHAKRGCPMFDCEDGYSNWRLGFSEAKKAWCCENYGMACERSSSSSSEASDHHESFSQEGPFSESHDCDGDPQEWSTSKLQWCCLVEHRGCLSDLQKELEEDYDCSDVGRSSVWPPEKIAWCCFEKGVACEVESFTVQRPPPPESQEDDSSLYFVLLLLVVIAVISYYRAKGGHSRRSFSFGPSPSGTTYGRGVYSALGSRYTPPSLPS